MTDATDAERLYRALSLVLGMLDHCTSDAVAPQWRRRYPDQYRHAVSLIRRGRVLLAELRHLKT
jgi:hypothetical protein